MSWWMRSAGRASAARVPRLGRRSVSRKLPPTIQKTSSAPRRRRPPSRPRCSPVKRRRREAPDAAPGVARWRRRSPGTQPTSAPPCTPEWPRIGISPRPVAPTQSARQADVDQRLDGVDAVRVLREPHRPDEDRVRARRRSSRAKRRISAARGAALRFERRPRRAPAPRRARPSKPAVRASTNASVDRRRPRPAPCSTPTRNARSPPVWTSNQSIGEPRAEHRARRRSTAPSSAPGPARGTGSRPRSARRGCLASCRYFVVTGWLFGVFDAEEHDEVGVEPVDVAAGRGAVAERALHRRRGRGVAEARRVVDVVGAERRAPPSARRSRPRW